MADNYESPSDKSVLRVAESSPITQAELDSAQFFDPKDEHSTIELFEYVKESHEGQARFMGKEQIRNHKAVLLKENPITIHNVLWVDGIFQKNGTDDMGQMPSTAQKATFIALKVNLHSEMDKIVT